MNKPNETVSPKLLDLRVRERNVQSGVLDPKAVETYLAELPDLEAQAEEIDVAQPALGADDSAD